MVTFSISRDLGMLFVPDTRELSDGFRGGDHGDLSQQTSGGSRWRAVHVSLAWAVPPGFNVQGRLTDSNGVNRNGNTPLSSQFMTLRQSGVCSGR